MQEGGQQRQTPNGAEWAMGEQGSQGGFGPDFTCETTLRISLTGLEGRQAGW